MWHHGDSFLPGQFGVDRGDIAGAGSVVHDGPGYRDPQTYYHGQHSHPGSFFHQKTEEDEELDLTHVGSHAVKCEPETSGIIRWTKLLILSVGMSCVIFRPPPYRYPEPRSPKSLRRSPLVVFLNQRCQWNIIFYRWSRIVEWQSSFHSSLIFSTRWAFFIVYIK